MALTLSSAGIDDGTNDVMRLDTTVNSESHHTDRQVGLKGAFVIQNDGIQATTDHGGYTTYYRRLSVGNQGYTGSPTHTTVYHWFTITGVDVPTSGGNPMYLELRVCGTSGHAGGSRTRLLGCTFTSYGATMSGGMGCGTFGNSVSPAPAYPSTMDVWFYKNSGANHLLYMQVSQAMREPRIAVYADCYVNNSGNYRHRAFDIEYHGQSTSTTQNKPADADHSAGAMGSSTG